MQKTSKLLFAALALSVIAAPVAGMAAEPSGPTYTSEQISNFDLGGLKLGMTAKEAEASLKAAGYEGKFEKTIGDRTTAWQQVDRALFPFRYVAKDGEIRLWSIQFQQKFDVNMSEDALKEKVIAKYGRPTRVENGKLVYESAWPFDRDSAMTCMMLDGNCRMDMVRGNPYKSHSEFEAAFRAAEARPQLRIEIFPKQITVYLTDRAANKAAEEFRMQQAKNAEEDKRRQAAKTLDLGL